MCEWPPAYVRAVLAKISLATLLDRPCDETGASQQDCGALQPMKRSFWVPPFWASRKNAVGRLMAVKHDDKRFRYNSLRLFKSNDILRKINSNLETWRSLDATGLEGKERKEINRGFARIASPAFRPISLSSPSRPQDRGLPPPFKDRWGAVWSAALPTTETS